MNHETGAHLSLPENLPFLPGTDAAMVLPRAFAQEAKIYIYSLNLMGQAKTNHEMAILLYRQIKDRGIPCDMLVTIEAKAIALTQELAVLLGQDYYIVLRKSVKAYMRDTLRTAVRSITTEHKQFLYLDGRDAELLKTVRHPVFIDDVISTGASFNAANSLIQESGREPLTVCACVATEGKALEDNPRGYIRLGHLPLFNAQGEAI